MAVSHPDARPDDASDVAEAVLSTEALPPNAAPPDAIALDTPLQVGAAGDQANGRLAGLRDRTSPPWLLPSVAVVAVAVVSHFAGPRAAALLIAVLITVMMSLVAHAALSGSEWRRAALAGVALAGIAILCALWWQADRVTTPDNRPTPSATTPTLTP